MPEDQGHDDCYLCDAARALRDEPERVRAVLQAFNEFLYAHDYGMFDDAAIDRFVDEGG